MAQQLPARADLEHYRKAAKALVKALRAADPAAAARARAVLGARAARPATLAAAQLVVAREHGQPSWPAFRRAVLAAPAAAATATGPADGAASAVSGPGTGTTDQPGLAAALAAARATWGEHGEALLDTDRRYTPGRPVRVLIRKRGPRYDLDDRGEAVRLAGAPDGWLVAAQRAVESESLNVNRRGVVFVPGVEGRDLVRLACRVADASLAVHAALLELDRER